MRIVLILTLASVLLVGGASAAWRHERDTTLNLVFDGSQQKHPKSAVIALPIVEPIIRGGEGPLAFEARYTTRFQSTDDSRNGKGRVTMRIEVVRDDRVLWKTKRKDKVKDDWNATRDCGNCTHRKLRVCRGFNGDLIPGDLVLFSFKFQDMPQFESSEGAYVDAKVRSGDFCG